MAATALMPMTSKATHPHAVGEMLEYEVSFMGMKIGTIKTYTRGDEAILGDNTHHVRAEIKSAPGIPYVDLNVVFDSWMDPSFAYSHKFRSTEISEGKKTYEEAIFDYDNKQIKYEKKVDGKVVENDDHSLTKKVNDGCSLFFMARKYLNRNKTVKVPTYIEDENSLTVINFRNKSEDVEIDAVDYPVATKYLDGTANWKGLYGLSGNFEGWFSDDDAAIPVKAKMNVYIGSVDIELVKWSRSGWNPPKASGS
jgi:hypothetical protein